MTRSTSAASKTSIFCERDKRVSIKWIAPKTGIWAAKSTSFLTQKVNKVKRKIGTNSHKLEHNTPNLLRDLHFACLLQALTLDSHLGAIPISYRRCSLAPSDSPFNTPSWQEIIEGIWPFIFSQILMSPYQLYWLSC